MDTIHDLGGKQGFGPVNHHLDNDAVQFTDEWKARTWAIAMMLMSKLTKEQTGWTLDWYRHVLERLPPDLYLRFDYFEKWLLALMVTAIDEEVANLQDILDGHAGTTKIDLKHIAPVNEGPEANRFKTGDKVVSKRDTGSMHTRLPAYVRGRSGVVESVIGMQALADRSAVGKIRMEQTYVVRFAMSDLWPEASNSRDALLIDMWDSYLEAA